MPLFVSRFLKGSVLLKIGEKSFSSMQKPGQIINSKKNQKIYAIIFFFPEKTMSI